MAKGQTPNTPVKKIALDLGLSFLLGNLASLAMLLWHISASEGSVPPRACRVVEGTGGLLPLGPYEPGEKVFSCAPDPVLFLFYLALPGLCFSIVLFALIRAVRRWRGPGFGGN